MGPRLCSRGNRRWPTRPSTSAISLQWGHGSSCRGNDRRAASAFSGVVVASMGPRLCSRGNAPRSSCAWFRAVGFNGATALHAVEMLRSAPLACESLPSFNGATALKPWKYRFIVDPKPAGNWLQWGHGSEAVEICHAGMSDLGGATLQWGHGSAAVEILGEGSCGGERV